jgi:hypothetical protein
MIDPSEPYDLEKIERRLLEIDRELKACEKLKRGPWTTEVRDFNHHWHDDPQTSPIEIHVREGGTKYPIAGGTIYNTQRELYFMAAMREAFPEALKLERAALAQLQGALLREQRRKKRATSR